MNIDTINRATFAANMAIRADTPDGWRGMARVWRNRLSPENRMALALAALLACDADDAQDIVDGLTRGAGAPGAALISEMDQAVFWADLATPDELDAYCLASFRCMAPHRQSAFLSFVQRRAAA